MSNIKYIEVKSITPKTVNGGRSFTKSDVGREIGIISGIVESWFDHETKFGAQIGFKGSFLAYGHGERVVYESEALFPPNAVTDQIKSKLDEGENEISVEFAVKLVESDKNDRGYAVIADQPKTKERVARRKKLVENFQAKLENIPLLEQNDSQ